MSEYDKDEDYTEIDPVRKLADMFERMNEEEQQEFLDNLKGDK